MRDNLSMRRLPALFLVAVAVAATGCGTASSVPTAQRIGSVEPGVGSSRVGPYRFVGQPVVMRWDSANYLSVPPPSYDVHFRLSGSLHAGDPYLLGTPVPVRIDGARVYVIDRSRRGNCYYASGSDTPRARRVLDAARIGQRVIVSVVLNGHGVHGTLRASVRLQLRRAPKRTDKRPENADGVLPYLWARLGCPRGPVIELAPGEDP
jgi:hypothetical protein